MLYTCVNSERKRPTAKFFVGDLGVQGIITISFFSFFQNWPIRASFFFLKFWGVEEGKGGGGGLLPTTFMLTI